MSSATTRTGGVVTFLKVFAFVLATVSLYAYVGQLVPQFEEHPPAKRTIGVDTAPEELAAIGEELARVKGGCLVCHKVTEAGNDRGPDLRQAAGRAGSRREGMDAETYLIESLVDPDIFLAPGYPRMMPSAVKPPANFSMAEVKATVAYMQVLGGGEITVRVDAADIQVAKGGARAHKGREAMATHGCIACHKVTEREMSEGGEVGPELTKVGAGRTAEELLRKIVDPAAWTTEGYQAGLMPAMPIPDGERAEIVAYLLGLSGKQWSPTGAASPWSHEGVRLGLVVLVFNLGMLLALAIAARRDKLAAAREAS